MNPSRDRNIPSPINLQTYYKCRRQDRESAASGSQRESLSSAEVDSAAQGKADGEHNCQGLVKTPSLKGQGNEVYQGCSPLKAVEDHLEKFMLDGEMNATYAEKKLDKMLAVIPDIMQAGCEEDIQTRARYKTCITGRGKELPPPAREKRNTAAVQSMMEKGDDWNYGNLEMKKEQHGREDDGKKQRRTRSEIVIGAAKKITKTSSIQNDLNVQNCAKKRAESADSFLTKERLSFKEFVKISYWGVMFEGKLIAARSGFSPAAFSSNAQMDMMINYKEHFSPIFKPDSALESHCKNEICRLYLHRESLRRISGDYLKHDANRVQFKECCLSGKCGGVHVNPFKCMSDQQLLCRGFQAEEIYAKMLICSHDLLINSDQLLSQFIQFALVHESYTFNRLYKALEFLLCWIRYRPRTFQTNPVMLGRIQAFIELLSLKYSPRNNSFASHNCCALSGIPPNLRNTSLCSCKEFLFGEKELQSRSRVNSKPSSFLDASQDSTAVQGSQINHSQKKRGPPAAAVRAPVPNHLAKKLLSNIEIAKPLSSSENKNSGKELKSPQLEKQPVLTRQTQSQQSPTTQGISRHQQISSSDTKVEDNQRIPLNADNIDRISIDFNLSNNPISSSSSSSGYSQNHHLSLFAGNNSHFSNQLSTRDSLRNIIPSSGSQSISTKQIPISKQSTFIMGAGSLPAASADSGNFSSGVKSMVSERTNTNSLSNGILGNSSSFLQVSSGGGERRFEKKVPAGQAYPNSRCQTIFEQISSNSLMNDSIKARRNTDWAPIQEEWQVFEKDDSFLEEHEIYELTLEKQARKDEEDLENLNNTKRTHIMTSSRLGTSEEKQQSNIQDQILRNQFIEQQNKLLEHASGEEQEAIRSASYFLKFQNHRASNNSSSMFSMVEQGSLGEQQKDKYQNTQNNSKINNNKDSNDHIGQSNQQSQCISFEQAAIEKRIKDEFTRRRLLSTKIQEIQQTLSSLTSGDNNRFCGCLDDCLVEQLKSSWSVEGMLRSEERLNRSLENFKFSRDIFLVVDPAILTQQLCLIDHQLFKDIHIQELFSDKRLKSLGIFKQFAQRNHLNALRERINVFTYYLVLLVLVQNSDRERLNFLQRILEISEYSVKYQNFCVTLSVYFLLNSTNLMLVLPPLLNKLQPHQQQQLKDLENTIQFAKSFGNLKNLMLNAQPPLVPALNIITRDMTLVDQQMSDYVTLDDVQFLNLDKFELVAQTTNIFYKAQSHDYPFVLRPSLYNFFKHSFKAFMGQYININDSKAIDNQLQALAVSLQSRK